MDDAKLPALSSAEDTFALAVIEYGGNLGAAWKSVFGPNETNATAKARELITKPEVALRIQQLSTAVEEHAYISLGSHLTKLAEIRDLAIATDQLKTALGAETKRGEAAGFYTSRLLTKDPNAPAESSPHVVINIGSSSANVQEWAAKHGKQPVVIDI
jgi:phage terminase small subunit